MSRTLKNGFPEKYSKVEIYGGGNVTQADKLLLAKLKRLRRKRRRVQIKEILRVVNY